MMQAELLRHFGSINTIKIVGIIRSEDTRGAKTLQGFALIETSASQACRYLALGATSADEMFDLHVYE